MELFWFMQSTQTKEVSEVLNKLKLDIVAAQES